jgi:stress response protein YsnF
VRKNRLSDSRESSSTGQLIKILSHENNEQKFDEDERLLQLMKERLVKNNGALTAQSVGKEISSSRARMSMALMKHEKLIKIS